MSKVSVIGAGSWGTALAILLEKNGHCVTFVVSQRRRSKRVGEKQRTQIKIAGGTDTGGD